MSVYSALISHINYLVDKGEFDSVKDWCNKNNVDLDYLLHLCELCELCKGDGLNE